MSQIISNIVPANNFPPTNSKSWLVRVYSKTKKYKLLVSIEIIIACALLFLISQIVGIYAVGLFGEYFHHFQGIQAVNWLNNDIFSQFWYVFIAEGLLVLMVFKILRIFKKDRNFIGLNNFKLVYILYAVGLYVVFIISATFIINGLHSLIPALNTSQAQQIGFSNPTTSLQKIATFLSLVILAPIAEEILFRGLLFESLKRNIGLVWSAALSCLIFAGAHLWEGGSSGLFIVGALDILILSVFLIFLKIKTKSLYPGILLHMTNNFISFLYLYIIIKK